MIIAILVIIVGGIIIYLLARLIHNKLGPSATTNSVQVGYATNYGWPQNVTVPVFVVPLETASDAPVPATTFTFTYGLWCSNVMLSLPTNEPPVNAGDVQTMVNTSNELAVAINMNGYEQFIVCDGDGNLLLNSSNVCTLVVQKSIDLNQWTDVYTNENCVPGQAQTFMDTIQSNAFYRIKL